MNNISRCDERFPFQGVFIWEEKHHEIGTPKLSQLELGGDGCFRMYGLQNDGG